MQPREVLSRRCRRVCRLSDLVNDAYGLTPDEIMLMWDPAPTRMPLLPENIAPCAAKTRTPARWENVRRGGATHLARPVN